jgi:D-glycero-D-manno-heptose 1,7-bisphosphate phosphatase
MLVILDKDGTLVTPKSGKTFVRHPRDQALLSGVKERIAALKAAGATLVIASNQGGVAAGHKSHESVEAEMRYCMELLPEISEIWYCTDFEGKTAFVMNARTSVMPTLASSLVGCEDLVGTFRKPAPGMLIGAMRFCQERQVAMVGDRPEDEQAAAAAGVSFTDAVAWREGLVEIVPAQLG